METIIAYKQLKNKKLALNIKAERIRAVPPKRDGDKLLFYIRIYLEESNSGNDFINLSDVNFVQYDLDGSFNRKTMLSKELHSGFEIRIWAYDFFNVKCLVFLPGRTEELTSYIAFDKSNYND